MTPDSLPIFPGGGKTMGAKSDFGPSTIVLDSVRPLYLFRVQSTLWTWNYCIWFSQAPAPFLLNKLIRLWHPHHIIKMTPCQHWATNKCHVSTPYVACHHHSMSASLILVEEMLDWTKYTNFGGQIYQKMLRDLTELSL